MGNDKLASIAAEIKQEYRAGSPRSREYFERGRGSMAGPAKGAYYYPPYPLTMDWGEGCYLHDLDGRRFLDCANHHTTQVVGHNHPAVLEAVRRQIGRGFALGAPAGVEAELSEEMCSRVKSVDRIRFCNSGTEATLHAIRLARGASGRSKIAKFEGGYHGSHDAVEISVAPPLEKAGPADAPLPVPTAGGMAASAIDEIIILPYNDEDAVERLLTRHHDELACVIFDPKAGILPQRKEFVQFVRKITRQLNLLLIFDEIVGFRVGRGGLQEYYGIHPDLTTYGKVVGGGFPAGAFGGRADLMDLLDPTGGSTGFFQSGSFSANPLVMVAGHAMLQQLTPETFEHVNGLGNRLRDGLQERFRSEGLGATAVVLGSLFSIYFSDRAPMNYREMARCDSSHVRPVFLSLLHQGYFLSHTLGMNALSTPMKPSDIDGLIEAVVSSIKRVTAS